MRQGKYLGAVVLLSSFSGLVAAQSTTDSYLVLAPTDCVATPVTFSSCSSFVDKLDNCFYTLEATAVANCWCPQSVLNYLAGCYQEWWNCLQSTIVDDLFIGTTGLYYTWSSMCTHVHGLTYAVTTPIVTTPGVVYNQASCNDAALYCTSLMSLTDVCTTQYSDSPSDLTTCLCGANMVSLGSRCDVDVSQSCLGQTLAAASLYSNRVCGGVAVTGLASGTLLQSYTSQTFAIESTSTYVPPMPSSTVNTGAATTSVGKGRAGRSLAAESWQIPLVLGAILIILGS